MESIPSYKTPWRKGSLVDTPTQLKQWFVVKQNISGLSLQIVKSVYLGQDIASLYKAFPECLKHLCTYNLAM